MYVRRAIDRFRQSVVISRRRTAARPTARVVTKDRIVAGIRCAIDFGGLLGTRALGFGKAGLLSHDARRNKKSGRQNQCRRDPPSRSITTHFILTPLEMYKDKQDSTDASF